MAINHSLDGAIVLWIFIRIVFKVVKPEDSAMVEGYYERLFLHEQFLIVKP